MAATPKLDLKRELKACYAPSAKKFSVVDVPPINFIMVDGEGDPNTAKAYADAIGALYATAYTLKFARKAAGQSPDFAVMPLEGLWWSDDMDDFRKASKDKWKWTAMIAVPDFVTAADIDEAKRQAAAKKDVPALELLRLERFREGRAAQITYFGPYADEGPTIAALHDFIAGEGGKLRGRHHEIYLSDPRRTAPARLKTVIRQPFD
jgi:hypothetical protein